MFITLFIIFSIAILILGHELGHFLAAKAFGLRVDEFGIGFPPRAWGRRKGETLYSVNWIPFGGFVKIAGENDRPSTEGEAPAEEKGRLFYLLPAWKRILILLAGVTMNFLIAWALIVGLFAVGTAPSVMITDVEPGSPAEAAGIRPGDVVVGYETSEDFIKFIRENRGKEIAVTVRREGENMEFRATPRVEVGPTQGPLGVGFAGVVKRGLGSAIVDGFRQTIALAGYTFTAFAELIGNFFLKGAVPQDVVGLVGIFPLAQQVGAAGFAPLVQLIALISVNLSVLNLIPFPALDGGRILFVLIEKIKGSPIPRKVEGWVNAVGFVVLILLMVLITIRDISRL